MARRLCGIHHLLSKNFVRQPIYFSFQRAFHLGSVALAKLVQFNLSDIGEGIAEVQVKEWHVKTGDRVNEFDPLCEVQSDKASVTITSRYEGVVKKIHYAVDDIARVGKPLCDIEIDDSASAESGGQATTTKEDGGDDSSSSSSSDDEAEKKPSKPKEGEASAGGKPLATPAVRRIAMENKLDLSKIRGTGKDGRVLKEDVLVHIGAIPESARSPPHPRAGGATPPPAAAARASPRVIVAAGTDRTEPIRGYTRAMVKTMTAANKIPHFGYNEEVCVDRLVDLRQQLAEIGKDKGVKMSYMPLFIKAASLALHQFPVINASVDENVENITYKAAHNICVAMDTPTGLVVPNIKNCEQKNLWEIAADLTRLHEAGKKSQIARADLVDGTFTLSNIGSIGGTYAHPVIFPPQVAIGAVGKMQRLPRFNAQLQVYPANIIRVSWAADHRVIDGATMARFSNVWKQYLEYPALMIAELK